MQILSPYGKDIHQELQEVYGFSSVHAFEQFLRGHIKENYTLDDFTIECIHVAFGLTVEVKARKTYFLKFASLTMHSHPEQLFPWLDYLHHKAVPIPKIIPAKNGAWFLSPLQKSDYQVVYLMEKIDGAPLKRLNAEHIYQYAKAMSTFHRIGSDYPHSNKGSIATWEGKWGDRQHLWDVIIKLPYRNQSLVEQAIKVVEKTGLQEFPKTIIHGDFRLCHVLFDREQIKGIIDVDQSTQGEKFIDLCYGLVSGSSPESGSLLNHEQVLYAIHVYHYFSPLSKEEISSLKALFAYAALESLSELVGNVVAGTVNVQEIKNSEDLLQGILETKEFLQIS